MDDSVTARARVGSVSDHGFEPVHSGAIVKSVPTVLEVATHESAHAVVGMCQRPPLHIRRLWLDPQGERLLGFCECSPRIPSAAFQINFSAMTKSSLEWDAIADATDKLAGPVAEELWRRRSIRDLLIIGEQLRGEFDTYGTLVGHETAPDGYLDLEQAERVLLWTFGEQAQEQFSHAWDRALDLVVRHRHAIRRLARALSLRGSLEYGEIVDIIGSDLSGPRRRRRRAGQ